MPHQFLPDVIVTKCGTAISQDFFWITAVHPRPTQKQSVSGRILLDLLGLIDVLIQRKNACAWNKKRVQLLVHDQSVTRV
jgi:hypothetical protein